MHDACNRPFPYCIDYYSTNKGKRHVPVVCDACNRTYPYCIDYLLIVPLKREKTCACYTSLALRLVSMGLLLALYLVYLVQSGFLFLSK